jgi:nuclear pore complex protein Nup93
MEVDAVHFAIALTYYGLLRVPDLRSQSDTEICKPVFRRLCHFLVRKQLTILLNIVTGKAASTPATAQSFMSANGNAHGGADIVYCNFARLIQRYIRNFVRIDPQAALQYVYLLSLNADAPASVGDEQVQACWDMIQAVILETRSYSLVLNEKTAEGKSVVSPFRSLKRNRTTCLAHQYLTPRAAKCPRPRRQTRQG